LATLAWLVQRGELDPSPDVIGALQYCIHCNACTANCVYLDQPVDITPLVRWARANLIEKGFAARSMRQLLEKAARLGNPYGDIREPRQTLIQETNAIAAADAASSAGAAGGTLIVPDAYGLVHDPASAVSAVRLLQQLGYPHVSISSSSYLGWELWQYGYGSLAARLAQTLSEEIERLQPSTVIPLSPASAYLLRTAYPQEKFFTYTGNVMTLAEAVAEAAAGAVAEAVAKAVAEGALENWRDNPRSRRQGARGPGAEKVYLVLANAETYPLHSLAAREVLSLCGVNLAGLPNHLPYRWNSYPEGEILDLDPHPGDSMVQRAVSQAKSEQADAIVCTSAHAVHAFRKIQPGLPVFDWASFVLGRIP
jgi:hypothetical protein